MQPGASVFACALLHSHSCQWCPRSSSCPQPTPLTSVRPLQPNTAARVQQQSEQGGTAYQRSLSPELQGVHSTSRPQGRSSRTHRAAPNSATVRHRAQRLESQREPPAFGLAPLSQGARSVRRCPVSRSAPAVTQVQSPAQAAPLLQARPNCHQDIRAPSRRSGPKRQYSAHRPLSIRRSQKEAPRPRPNQQFSG